MRRPMWVVPGLIVAAGLVCQPGLQEVSGQQASFPRLPSTDLVVTAPSARVAGDPGTLTLRQAACHVGVGDQELRSRIVDIATQEWGYFGFPVFDHTVQAGPGAQANGAPPRFSRAGAEELLRTATSVAGYWAVTAEGAWIVDRQNTAWNGSRSVNRWLDPWSAAFVSWVMCEAGLGERERFQRAVAHHTYIDQAIRARDGRAPGAAFTAYDIGESEIAPGDLLCSGRRPAYQSLADRRRQMGSGAATHCDIVVSVDPSRQRILTIGGNVRGTVGLKLLPAERSPAGILYPLAQPPGSGTRVLFAHLKLGTEPIAMDALDTTPTMRTLLACSQESAPPPHLFALGVVELLTVTARC